MIHENLFTSTNQDSTIPFTWENSKMFNIAPKYFSIFNNKPPASWVAHITRNFLSCYSYSYYRSMNSLNIYFIYNGSKLVHKNENVMVFAELRKIKDKFVKADLLNNSLLRIFTSRKRTGGTNFRFLVDLSKIEESDKT